MVYLLKLPPWQGNLEGRYWAGNMLAYSGGYEIRPTRYVDDDGYGRSYVHMEGFVVDVVDGLSPVMTRDMRRRITN